MFYTLQALFDRVLLTALRQVPLNILVSQKRTLGYIEF